MSGALHLKLIITADLDVAPDEYFLTTKKELWSFYLYYVGNSCVNKASIHLMLI